jgi:site-specific recombinase XerC
MKPYRKPKAASTALTVAETPSTDLALPADLIGKAKDYAAKSRSERTLTEYRKWFAKYVGWCDANGRTPMPASPETLAGFMTWLASGQGAAKPMASASISVAVSAIKFAHRTANHVLDTDHPGVQSIWTGIRREIAKTRTTRRVRPIMAEDLREMLEMLRPDVPREARDAALLALGWSGALRRSELAALDLERPCADGKSHGFIAIDDRGITITLMTSKASQDTAQTVVIPRDFTPISCRVIENWVRVGTIKPGSPLFRGVKGRGWSLNPQSGYTGVTWSKTEDKWIVVVRTKDRKSKHLGYFVDPYEGHVAYCKHLGLTPTRRKDNAVSEQRIDPSSIAVMIKSRIRMLVEARNAEKSRKKMSKEDIDTLTKAFSGHSMRVGYVTSAAGKDVSNHRIKQQTRHKTDTMLSVYVREVDKYKKSGLDGVGV